MTEADVRSPDSAAFTETLGDGRVRHGRRCETCGPIGDEFPDPIPTGNHAGRCVRVALFAVAQDDEPKDVCYGHLAQTVASGSPRRPITVSHLGYSIGAQP